MAEKKNQAVSFLVATFILAAALTLAQENRHPVATIVPPAKFDATPTPSNQTTTKATTTPTTNTTTTKATPPPTTNTTTTAPPQPTKPTSLTLGDYNVTDGSQICIRLKAAIQIYINNSQVNGTYIVQPHSTKSYGQCKNGKDGKLILSFPEGSIELRFLKNETTKMVYAYSVAVNLSYAFTSGALTTFNQLNESVKIFNMIASHSYSCKSEMVYLGDSINLDFSQERLQAFDIGKDGEFGPVDLCKADQPNYSVAIAVGIVLIVLIVIVVIAYLVSRRKRTDGYQTL